MHLSHVAHTCSSSFECFCYLVRVWVSASWFSGLGLGFGVWGLRVWGLGLRAWGLGLGFGVWGVGFEGLEFGVWGLGFGVCGLWFRVRGLGFRVSGFGLRECTRTCFCKSSAVTNLFLRFRFEG